MNQSQGETEATCVEDDKVHPGESQIISCGVSMLERHKTGFICSLQQKSERTLTDDEEDGTCHWSSVAWDVSSALL